MTHKKNFMFALILILGVMYARGQIKKGNAIDSITKELAANNIYERSYTVGYAGSASRQLELFQKLRSIASEKELTKLCLHNKNAVVRLYAFQALKQKAKTIAELLQNNFKTESSIVVTLTGCIAHKEPVSSLACKPLIDRENNILP